MLEVSQGEFDGFAAGNHPHTAGSIVSYAPLPALPLGKIIAAQEPAKALSGYPILLLHLWGVHRWKDAILRYRAFGVLNFNTSPTQNAGAARQLLQTDPAKLVEANV